MRASSWGILDLGLSGMEGPRNTGDTLAAALAIGALAERRWRVSSSAIAANERAERTMAALLRLQTAEVQSCALALWRAAFSVNTAF